MKKLSMKDLKNKGNWDKAVIVFTEESFNEKYTEEERSYKVSSEANYFDGSKMGDALRGNCLDGKDLNVRLDLYLYDITLNESGWYVDYCYILE